jgi:hypothetical protein
VPLHYRTLSKFLQTFSDSWQLQSIVLPEE